MANSRPTTSAKNWKKRTGGVEIELPSGNIAKVKRPGMEKLLAAGVLPDRLTPIAMQAVKEGEGGKPEDEQKVMEEFMQDSNALADIFLAFDRITAMCVVEPKVRMHQYTDDDPEVIRGEARVGQEIPEDRRDEDLLYTDDVDMEDKTFIFQFVVGGSADLERFRRESAPALATVQSGEDLERQTQPTPEYPI